MVTLNNALNQQFLSQGYAFTSFVKKILKKIKIRVEPYEFHNFGYDINWITTYAISDECDVCPIVE